MNEREALKLAQKAMGLIGADLVCEAAHHEKKDRHQIGEPCPIQARWHRAFAAIKEALAKPEQEPEAWVGEIAEGAELMLEKPRFRAFPLYTDPPQRTWVGLTDDEWQELAHKYDLIIWSGFKRNIEAKLKQKNGYAEEKNV